MPEAHTPVSITGNHTSGSTLFEVVPLVVDGAAPANSIAVPPGTQLVLSDVAVCAAANAAWKLEQTNDGVTWFNIGLFEVPGVITTPTKLYSVRTGWVIQGGVDVAIRMECSTAPATTVQVVTTLRGYRAP